MSTLFVQRWKMFLPLLAASLSTALPLAAAFAQSSSSQQSSSGSQPSSSQQPSSQSQTQTPPPSQSGATIDPPAQKQESLAEAARKAKANKPSTAKPKVFTEDDISGMKGPGVSVVGSSPDGDGDYDPNGGEAYWRGRAQQILDAIAATDEAIEQKREEIKKYGSGGFDVTTGRQNNIAYINDREGQLKQLEKHKAGLQKQLDDLADEGRKAGASPAWFR